MGRAPCCSKDGLHRGPWTPREDSLLTRYIQAHGEGRWRSLPKKAGLLRCGKSCRLRWMNYLRPDIKRGNITPDEEDLIIRLHALLGNRWSLIAGRLPGRTDNEIKNYWNTHLSKRLRNEGTDPNTHKKLSDEPIIQDARKRRNSKNGGHKKNQNYNNNMTVTKPSVEPRKHKVHLPKPIKVTSFVLPIDESFKFNDLFDSVSKGHGELGTVVPSCSFKDSDNGAGYFVGDFDDDIVNGSDFEYQISQVFTGENSLDKLYEEYLQILKNKDEEIELDSVAESFLV